MLRSSFADTGKPGCAGERAWKDKQAGRSTAGRSLAAVRKANRIERLSMTNEEARTIQLEEYAKVYRPEAAADAVKALEDRLAARGMTLAEYVTEQKEIQARIRAYDAESAVARSEAQAQDIERIHTLRAIADDATCRKATALLQTELRRDYWWLLLGQPETRTLTELEILEFIKGQV